MTTTQPTPDQRTSPLDQAPLNTLRLPQALKECLQTAYDIWFTKYDHIKANQNVLYDLSHFEEFQDHWLQLCEHYPASTIYKAFITDFYRIRQPHPEKYRIRWFRKEWYGPEDYETSPQISWKVFAQRVGNYYQCPQPKCNHSSYYPNRHCPKHHTPLLNKMDEEHEYKKLNKALSDLVDQNIITYNDIRILNIAHDKNAIRPAMKSFRYEQGWKRVILCIEKAAMFTDDLLNFCHKYGLVVIAGGGEPSRSASETLYRILNGQTCLKCLKNKTEIEHDRYNNRCINDSAYGHDFYEYDHTIYIIALTDFDPAGYYIARSFKKHFETYENVKYKRIGLTHDQIESLNLPQHKFIRLKPTYQGWNQAFYFDNIAYGVEMDSVSWHFYFDLVIQTLIDLLGSDGWNDYALEQSAESYPTDKAELIRETAEEWIKEPEFQSPLYQLYEHQISEINAILNHYYHIRQRIADKQAECIDPLIDAIEAYLSDSELEAQEDFDEREAITDEIITDMLQYTSFDKTVRTHFDNRSVLDNALLIDKINDFFDVNKEEIKDEFLQQEYED